MIEMLEIIYKSIKLTSNNLLARFLSLFFAIADRNEPQESTVKFR